MLRKAVLPADSMLTQHMLVQGRISQHWSTEWCGYVCRAMEAAADGAGDIAGQAYWWSNCIQLRWMLWAMCRGGDPDGDPDSEEFDWVMQVRSSTLPLAANTMIT